MKDRKNLNVNTLKKRKAFLITLTKLTKTS